MDHEGKQPTFAYLRALLFEERTRHLFSQGNNLTEDHDGPQRQALTFVYLCVLLFEERTRHSIQPGE